MGKRYRVLNGRLFVAEYSYRFDPENHGPYKNCTWQQELLEPTGNAVDLPDGYYRFRRGKMVRIPDEWVGQVVHKQTRKKRLPSSRRTRSSKKKIKR